MRISVLSSDPSHPVIAALRQWQSVMAKAGNDVSLHFCRKDLQGGDMLFLVSCSDIISTADRSKFAAALVLHASDLPRGRGWSPHIWSIIGGSNEITVCLVEAAEPVDSGPIWIKTKFQLKGHELLPEINAQLFRCELDLMTQAVQCFGEIVPTEQSGTPGPYMRKRTPDDSRLDANKSIAEQFDLLRVVDNQRFPAFVEHRGTRYLIKIEKAKHDS